MTLLRSSWAPVVMRSKKICSETLPPNVIHMRSNSWNKDRGNTLLRPAIRANAYNFIAVSTHCMPTILDTIPPSNMSGMRDDMSHTAEKTISCEIPREKRRTILDLPVLWNIRTVLWGGTEHSQDLFLLEWLTPVNGNKTVYQRLVTNKRKNRTSSS